MFAKFQFSVALRPERLCRLLETETYVLCLMLGYHYVLYLYLGQELNGEN